MKNFCSRATDWEKTFTNVYLTENLYTGYVKNSQNSTVIKHRPQFKNGQKTRTKSSPRRIDGRQLTT